MGKVGAVLTVLVLAVGCGPRKTSTKAPSGSDGQQESEAKRAGEYETDGYSMADLQALQRQKSYEELLAHMSDIRPGSRDDYWEELLEAAAIGYLEQVADHDHELLPIEVAERLTDVYPLLEGREAFMKARAEHGVNAYKRCYASNCRHYLGRGSRAWQDAVYEFAETDPKNTGFIAGKMMMVYLIPEVATGLFAMSVEHEGAKHCDDADLRRSVREAKVEGVWKDEVDLISRVCKLGGQVAER